MVLKDPFQGLPKIYQIWGFGMKINHLATLLSLATISRNIIDRFITSTLALFSSIQPNILNHPSEPREGIT
jgi:hypothetical protein